ncbi:hypothetical protein A1704_03830 [Chryseobacterium cucumeris]|uniref:hypothetical protein n=1 Tax=Chryseobacterium cucumeris TaxID=1813611 RepID=UPI000786B3C5|nr:hypothetical protein [Chryseobacterium cucumeris]KYH07805.1 hypothetical protein A1704_03830 [Chryseobacterium cucumeris]
MKTSINFKAVKPDSEIHNFRRKTFDYIRKELTVKNEYWQEDKIGDRLNKIQAYCKETSGRKLQSNAMPVREAVVVIKENTTMKDLFDLSLKLEKELGIRVFQIAIHKDEGHWDKESKEWKPNLHAHLVADWQDLKTGKTLKHQSFHYSKMQDITAECLGMERGIAGSVGRLEAVEFKIHKKEEELKALEMKINEMQTKLEGNSFKDLIVKETDFFGFEHIKTGKTIENYGQAFKLYNAELLKKNDLIESHRKQISDVKLQTEFQKKEISDLRSKNTLLITNPNVFAGEKKKYMDSVIQALKKQILSERLINLHYSSMDEKNLTLEMSRICKDLSEKNNIPFSAFEEIFTTSELLLDLFSMLSLGPAYNLEPEDIPLPKKKKKRRNIRY